MNYQHLIEAERYQMQGFLEEGVLQSGIARRLHRAASTIGREIERNAGVQGYQAKAAEGPAQQRRQVASSQPRIDAAAWAQIDVQLQEGWSPEQVAGRQRQQGGPTVSPERMYQHIAADHKAGGTLWTHRRFGKPRRRRLPRRATRFRDGKPLSERPVAALDRVTLGHWEGDTMVGVGLSRLVTLVERHSRFVVVVPVKDGCAETVLAAILHGLYPWQSAVPGCVTSIAWDNGSEFARHAVLDLALGCTSYFARPYASWERGSNENANGLIRQYAPKKTDLGMLTDDQVQRIADRLNDRPREVLAFRTPREVFEASLIAMQRQQKNRCLRKARAVAQVQRE